MYLQRLRLPQLKVGCIKDMVQTIRIVHQLAKKDGAKNHDVPNNDFSWA